MSEAARFPSSIQETIINADFEGQLLGNLLLGIYTVVYFGTLYIYSSKKSSKNWLVIGCITLSYITYVVQIGVQWDLIKTGLVNNGETRASAFTSAFLMSAPKASFVYDVTDFVLANLADGLMLWRCFHIWDRSIRVILLPLVLEITNIAMEISAIVLLSRSDFSQTATAHNLVGIGLFLTFATTFVTTMLIAYRIHSVSKEQGIPRGSKALFNHITEVLIQSAAAYCVVSLATAIAVTLATAIAKSLNHHTAILYTAQNYIIAFYAFTAGVAPTIMVARIAMAPNAVHMNTGPSGMTHISGLEFRAPPTASDITQLGTHMENGDDHLLHESKDLEVKEEGLLHIA